MRPVAAAADTLPQIDNELDLLGGLVPLEGRDIIELGCGAAALARQLLQRFPTSTVTALEVDARQHAKNLAAPQTGLHFMASGAQHIPLDAARFDLALMLKSLHHVPLPLQAQALGEIWRVLRPGGLLYVSEPVYAGPYNTLMMLFNDEGTVRAAAQATLDAALRTDHWAQVAERHFQMPVRFSDFNDFERRMMRPTFADHHIDSATLADVRAAFLPHCGPDGAHFQRQMHVRLLRRN